MTPDPRPRPLHRRAFLSRLAALGLGTGAALAGRSLIRWPTPAVRFREGSWSGWAPMPTPGGLIALPARIGWARVQAVVDSGAQYSAIDAGLAARLGLPSATPFPIIAFGVSGAPSLTGTVRLDLDLGGVAVTGLRAATLNLLPLSGLTHQPFAVLLGRDFLSAVVAETDFPERRVAFHRPDIWRPPPGATPIPVRTHARALILQVGVEGRAPVEVMLDTGATGALALSEPAARAAGLMDGRPLITGESVSLGGVSQDGVATAREIAVAGRTLRDVQVQIYRPPAHAALPAGLLGVGVLRRFHLALDHAQGRLFAMPPGQ